MPRIWTTALVAGAVLALALPATSSASCIGPLTTKQYERQADVVFVGVALQGPTPTGIQLFRVDRPYLKGSGPDTAAVATGVVARPDGSGSTTSVSIEVNAGERWQIYGRKRSGSEVLDTNQCAGSGRVDVPAPGGAGTPTDPPAAAAASDDDRTEAVLLAACLGVFAILSLAFLVHRRHRRTVTSAG